MRTLSFIFLLVTALAVSATVQGIHSHLLIDTGKQFVLGGDQFGGFRVAARNSGPVAVLLLERPITGAVRERGRLEPGQAATLSFSARSAVLVRNLGSQRAELDVDVKGPVNSKMTYEPNPAN